MLRQQQALWSQRKVAINDIDYLYREVIAAIPKEKAKREAERKAAAAAELLRKQRRIDDAYLRGLNGSLVQIFRSGPCCTARRNFGGPVETTNWSPTPSPVSKLPKHGVRISTRVSAMVAGHDIWKTSIAVLRGAPGATR
jgi:hypothetical protein